MGAEVLEETKAKNLQRRKTFLIEFFQMLQFLTFI